MNRLFGSSKATPKPGLSEAIASTEERAASVEVKVRKLDAELARYRDQMKKLRDGPGKTAVKERALRVLKQKKMYEAQLNQLQQQSFNMEQASMTTDNLRNTMATVNAMKVAQKQMKKEYGKIDIDKIEAVHFDMEDLLDQANEIQESLSRTYGVPDELDEADLQAELDALGDEAVEEDEIPSYLREEEKLPDFIDEPPTATPAIAEGAAPVRAT